MGTNIPVVVIGGGPAGLSVSYELQRAGVEHAVLERGRVAETWRRRWDSFCLVTPNWTVKVPGGEYAGDDPDGFMQRDDIVAHFQRYADAFAAPVHEGVDVLALRTSSNGFVLETSEGEIRADGVVVGSGAFQRPHRPPDADLPTGVLAIDSLDYTNPGDLPAGAILVVGSGQTGCQIAEELHGAGRDVTLACGKAAWLPRRLEGRDIVAWVSETPFLEQRLDELSSPLARLAANFQTTGRDGGHDLHYRTLAADGVTLVGRFLGAAGDSVRFAPDLHESVAWGDARQADMRTLLERTAQARGTRAPDLPEPEPFKADPPEETSSRGLGAMIFTSGFRPDYRAWIHTPGAFDDAGFPIQIEGASTVVPGLYFIGTHFLRKRKSSTLLGMAEDAGVVTAAIAERLS